MEATIAAFSLNPSTQNLSLRADRAGFILLGSFLLTFILIRISVRLMRSPKVPWWPGSIKTEGGLHVHHLVFGIVMMLLFGFLAIAVYLPDPWYDLVAGGFGAGAGLTLDEYALWLHLDDVYWAEEGRRSVDAVIVAAVIGGLILLGARPLTSSDTGSAIGLVVAVAVVLAVCGGALLKGRTMLGICGLVFPPLALWGLVRLARPDSPWARRRYATDSKRMRRAIARFERQQQRYRRWQDLIAGAPNVPALAEHSSAPAVAEQGSAPAIPDPRVPAVPDPSTPPAAEPSFPPATVDDRGRN
jgi:hypothetical protein